jgi:hypothetical protein
VPHVNRDAALIFVSAFVRSSTVGLVGVIVAIHLAQVGLSTAALGASVVPVWPVARARH